MKKQKKEVIISSAVHYSLLVAKLIRKAYRIGFNDGSLNRKPNEFNEEMIKILQDIKPISIELLTNPIEPTDI